MSPQEDHIRNIQIQLLAATDRMKAALDAGDFRKAELALAAYRICVVSSR